MSLYCRFSNMFSKFFILLIIGFFIISSSGCDKKRDSKNRDLYESDDEGNQVQNEDSEFQNCDTFPVIKYNRIVINDLAMLNSIRQKYGRSDSTREAWRAVTTLNRKEMRFFRIGDTIILPDMIHPKLMAYSVFPQCYPQAKNIDKLILVSNKMQCYACYAHGRLVRFAAANTGKERTPTFPGRYALVWKERLRRSSLDSNWVMPFTWNFHPQAGNAFHKFDMPGRPVSHSCVRQFMDDAEWLYSWGRGVKRDSSGRVKYMSGTPVIIIDIFDYSRKKGGPWLELKTNKDSILKLPDDPMNFEEALIPLVQIPKDSRGSLVNYKRYKYAEDTLRARGIIRPHVRLIETVDFNKLRREKAAKKAKAKAEKEKKVSTDDQLIKDKLKDLNGGANPR